MAGLSTAQNVKVHKLSGATAQPGCDGGCQHTWELTAPSDLTPSNANCSRLTVTANDGLTAFSADLTGHP